MNSGKKMKYTTYLLLIITPLLLFADDFSFYPDPVSYDPAIPTLEQVVGHAWGDNITDYHEMVRYIHALADASPNVTLVAYGESFMKRKMYYLIITSAENLARIDEIRDGMKRLSDPRKTNRQEADELIRNLPAITWLSYSVHGTEISSLDAALLTAYHLAAARNHELTDMILRESVVIIDPIQNPDGREWWINNFRFTRGQFDDSDPNAAERFPSWASGRGSRYHFDMNRDWLPVTHPESKAKIAAYLDWFPQVFVDIHEMRSDNTYYFPPPDLPGNPEYTDEQYELLALYGRNNSRWMDRVREDYFTREIFGSFYSGYGATWPMFHGSVGMTYEQGSARGMAIERYDGTLLPYHNTVRNHFLTSLSTAETTARNRERMLRHFYRHRVTAIEEGERADIKEYIIPPGSDPNRVNDLIQTLMLQGIKVQIADREFTNRRVRDYYSEVAQSRSFPEGTYIIPRAQPAGRLVETALARHVPQLQEYVDEQIRRRELRYPDQIYDVTAWSLPLMYGVEAYRAEQRSDVPTRVLATPPQRDGQIIGGRAHLAYLIPWGTNSAVRALADLHKQEIRVYSTAQPIVHNGNRIPPGSLIVRVAHNPDDLHERMEAIARDHRIEIYSAEHGWIEEGVNFGSSNVRYLEKPRIALVWDIPTDPVAAGYARFALEQLAGYPVTVIRTLTLRNAELDRYNVIIFPGYSGMNYTTYLGGSGVERLRQWIERGGTLLTFDNATLWLTDEEVGLLSTKREYRPQPEPTTKDENDPALAILPERELPDRVSGAILRVNLDTEHWLAFGYTDGVDALIMGNAIYTPLKLDKGRNVGLFAEADRQPVSGFVYEGTRQQISHKAYLMHRRHGWGNVIAFSDDPNFRGFAHGTFLLFANAVFRGPSTFSP
jgi:hypothetical protein